MLTLVQEHGLFSTIQDKLLHVAAGDPQRTVALLVEHYDKVSVSRVCLNGVVD